MKAILSNKILILSQIRVECITRGELQNIDAVESEP